MQQVLFHIPILTDWFGPSGLPINGFGVMLFITFVVCVAFLSWWSRKTGTNLPRDRVQDLVIVAFIGGLIGARITFMIQYEVPMREIIQIWKGGIVLYGGIVSGMLAFLAFYHFFLKKAGVSLWKLADACGPGLALGIALGRIGCFLNGCCYGHVAPEGCPAVAFPLLTCPASEVVIEKKGYQTPTGFTIKDRRPSEDRPRSEDIRSVVDRVEPESAAARAGLQPNDRIIGFNGQVNAGVLIVAGPPEVLEQLAHVVEERGGSADQEAMKKSGHLKILMPDMPKFEMLRKQLRLDLSLRVLDESDAFSYGIDPHNWPHGDQSLELTVNRGGQEVHIGPFTPRTIGLHPTQVYETISMLLLMLLLLAFYPFRRHDGQVFELFIVGYAVHRFLNETLRNDTAIVGIPQLHMTLSQNISVLMLLFAACLEIGRRRWGKPLAAPSSAIPGS